MSCRKQDNDEDRAAITLGSLIDLNLNGRLLDDVGSVLNGWSGINKRRCRVCHRRLRCIIGDGSRPIRARVKDPNDSLTECDACFDEITQAAKTQAPNETPKLVP